LALQNIKHKIFHRPDALPFLMSYFQKKPIPYSIRVGQKDRLPHSMVRYDMSTQEDINNFVHIENILQFFDTDGWVTGRASSR